MERANLRIIGRFEHRGGSPVVVPADKRIPYAVEIPRGKQLGAQEGQIVTALIERFPDRLQGPQGRVEEILGNEWDPAIEIEMIIRGHDLRTGFPAEVVAETEGLTASISREETAGRRDFRDLFTVTIDGLDAKDFDDAVSIERREKGWRVWVHIADVSHYVRPGSALFEEAEVRATSVYLVDRVLPMLPEILSNDVCSLRPQEERLTLSVEIDVGRSGDVERYWIGEGIIRSSARLTYEQVDLHFSGESAYEAEVESLLSEMRRLSEALEGRRLSRGALNFETVEPKVVLDEEGRPQEILVRERTPATQLIEETMILANETVAEFMAAREAPLVYRIHEEPDPAIIEQIYDIVYVLGYRGTLNLGRAEPSELQAVIDFASGRPEKLLINTLLIRAMQQARYSTANRGHYGLASTAYCHFTSPIRRMPDLVVHHLVKQELGVVGSGRDALGEMTSRLPALAEESSVQEREAEAAGRESTDVKICEYMQRHIGDSFQGMISGVTSFGFFVELANTAEGLVHVSDLDDDLYGFEPQQFLLRGRRSGKIYRLGQPVKVVLKRVRVGQRRLDFVAVGS